MRIPLNHTEIFLGKKTEKILGSILRKIKKKKKAKEKFQIKGRLLENILIHS